MPQPPPPARPRLALGLLLLALALSPGCPSPRPLGEGAGPSEPELDADDAGAPRAESLLSLERGLVLWFRAQGSRPAAPPHEAAFFTTRDERGSLLLESLGLGPSLRLRLVVHRSGIWLYPVGSGPANAASLIYHPTRSPGREVTLEGGTRARRVAHSEGGVELVLWLVPGEGLWRLELALDGVEQLRLERSGRATWGSRPAPYPADTPAAAWESVRRALRTLDVLGLRQLLTPDLWARLLPPGEGLAVPLEGVSQERRLELIRVVVPQLLETEFEPQGLFVVQGAEARGPARLRVVSPAPGQGSEREVQLRFKALELRGDLRWSWAGWTSD